MIIREWRGRAAPSNIEAYPEHFRTRVVPELRELPGFIGADLCAQRLADKVEFVVLSRWRSMDAVKAFAGDDVARAVVEPGAVAALADFDDFVRHYEIVEQV